MADDGGRFDSVVAPGGGQGDLQGEQCGLDAAAAADVLAVADGLQDGEAGFGADQRIGFGQGFGEGRLVVEQAVSHALPL